MALEINKDPVDQWYCSWNSLRKFVTIEDVSFFPIKKPKTKNAP